MDIVMLPSQVRSATLLADEAIMINGHEVNCQVIHIGENDFMNGNSEVKAEVTIWIEHSRNLIRKTYIRTYAYRLMQPSGGRVRMLTEKTTTYPVVELDEQEPESSFTFSPPTDAKLVESFPQLTWHEPPQLQAAHFIGKRAPDVQLKGSDGKITTLSAFRGKPIFIEFWSTWCPPCTDMMSDLKQLYSQTEKSLVWLSIDNDKNPDAATTYLSLEHIPWPNYHDQDGSLSKAFGRTGIPLAVLIDADGKILFYRVGTEMGALWAALARFSSPRMINLDSGFAGE